MRYSLATGVLPNRLLEDLNSFHFCIIFKPISLKTKTSFINADINFQTG